MQEAEEDASTQTMELQWKSYVSNLKASGTLSSALAVCDVSGSMSGEPMQVLLTSVHGNLCKLWSISHVYPWCLHSTHPAVLLQPNLVLRSDLQVETCVCARAYACGRYVLW